MVLRSAWERVFCAGANIKMLAAASHAHKVNFCKFTNETRNAMEDAGEHSGQKYLAAVTGSCAGGGYELALACEHILLVDDGSSSVSLPEVPLLAVLPGTGGLTRLTDKRKVRRDRADMFCCIEEGVRGQKAVDWRLVDEAVVNSEFDRRVSEITTKLASLSDRPDDAKGITLNPIQRRIGATSLTYSCVEVQIGPDSPVAVITVKAPNRNPRRTSTRCFAAATNSGASAPPVNWTTRYCTCASTKPKPASSSSKPPAARTECSPATRFYSATGSTGWCAKSCSTGRGFSSGST